MKLLRNKEVLRPLMIQIFVSTVFTFYAYSQSVEQGRFCLILVCVLMGIYLISMILRYQKINQLALDIDRILHDDSPLTLDQYAEGELSIVQSEIRKMTLRLQEQKQRLLDDKIYLADSIADISHQIRTPLTSINLLVSFLAEPGLSDERRLTLSQELYGLLSRIDWLITALLKISKLDAGTVQFQPEQVSLSALIQKAASPIAIPMELRSQELIVQASGDFYGDISWTCEALTNILKNCMEHTPDGGQIMVEASENALYTEIQISDTGCGIDEQDLPHIFERFYKGKNSDDQSFGIGLALARMIITSQNGTIKAENRTSSGAHFTLHFYKGII